MRQYNRPANLLICMFRIYTQTNSNFNCFVKLSRSCFLNEIYCFSSDTRWAYYEAVQSDIFDHLLAILPEFGLRVFQSSSDAPLSVNLRDQRVAGNGGSA